MPFGLRAIYDPLPSSDHHRTGLVATLVGIVAPFSLALNHALVGNEFNSDVHLDSMEGNAMQFLKEAIRVHRIWFPSILLLVSLIAAWMFRYDLVNETGIGAYRLDRWTGKIEFIRGARSVAVRTGQQPVQQPVLSTRLQSLARSFREDFPEAFRSDDDEEVIIKIANWGAIFLKQGARSGQPR